METIDGETIDAGTIDGAPTLRSRSFDRTEWFREARFGLFLHFGAYSVLEGEEWARSIDRLSIEQYQLAVDRFHPDSFDPEKWADDAVAAGMKYAILTAKHHDGFCLFDSALTDYSTMHNGFGRDLVREFLDAFRSRGLRVGLYYSLLDWHHPDYPAYDDEHHPHRGDAEWANHQPEFDNYLDYMYGQIEELCSNYGKLDILWFDFSYGSMTSETWRAAKVVRMVRSHQPDVLIDNRLETSGGGFGSIVTSQPTEWAGDFVSPEQLVPAEGIRNYAGAPVPWEACFTHNNHWGYYRGDNAFKPARMLVRKLVEIVSKGGNLLLNVGPRPDGTWPPQSVAEFAAVGEWLETNGESMFGAGIAEFPKPEWGFYTQNGNSVYAHVLEPPVGPLALTGIDPGRIGSMRLLATGQPLRRAAVWLTDAYPYVTFVSFGDSPTFTYSLPDDIDTVIEIVLADHKAERA